MTNKKIFFPKKLSAPLISLFAIAGLSAHFNACASDLPLPTLASNEAVLGETPSTKTDEAAKDKPDPTKEVAGGVQKGSIKPPETAVLPTGKTLPKGIFRARFITAHTYSDSGYTEEGKRRENGLDYNRWMSGVQLEYGLSKSISIGIGIPYVNSNKVTMDGAKFEGTEFYQKYYEKFVKAIAYKLAQSGAPCGAYSSCYNFIKGGGSLPLGTIILPTGEEATFTGATSLSSQIHNTIIAAATPSTGATGLGDIQLGFLWSAISEDSPIRHVPLYFSIGGGLRLPTGQFDLASAYRATGGDATLITGGGTYDVILRWNLDYVAEPGFILSWQHQMDYSLTKADLSRSSMKDPTNFNTADPSEDHGGHTGDGVGNNLVFSRKGIHEIGFFEAAWGLGDMSQKLKWLGLYTQAKYNIAAQAYLNDYPIYAMGDQFFLDAADGNLHKDHGAEQYYSAVLGTKFSGLPYMIPLEVSAEFEYPIAGKNRIVSPMNAQVALSLYF